MQNIVDVPTIRQRHLQDQIGYIIHCFSGELRPAVAEFSAEFLFGPRVADEHDQSDERRQDEQ